MLIILIQIFNFVGFALGLAIFFIMLATNKTVNGRRSYLYPLIPFNARALLSQMIRLRKDGTKTAGVRRGKFSEQESGKK